MRAAAELSRRSCKRRCFSQSSDLFNLQMFFDETAKEYYYLGNFILWRDAHV